MRTVLLNSYAPRPGAPRLGRLTRHLVARLLDFGPGGPQVLARDEEAGSVRAVFPGHATQDILSALERSCGVYARSEGDEALFLLQEDTRFEDLDYLWGCLFDLLG